MPAALAVVEQVSQYKRMIKRLQDVFSLFQIIKENQFLFAIIEIKLLKSNWHTPKGVFFQ